MQELSIYPEIHYLPCLLILGIICLNFITHFAPNEMQVSKECGASIKYPPCLTHSNLLGINQTRQISPGVDRS